MRKRPLSPTEINASPLPKIAHVRSDIENVFFSPASRYADEAKKLSEPDANEIRATKNLKLTFDASNQPKLFEVLARIETKLDSLGRSINRSSAVLPSTSSSVVPSIHLHPHSSASTASSSKIMTPHRMKPISNADELDQFENKLADEAYWNEVVSSIEAF